MPGPNFGEQLKYPPEFWRVSVQSYHARCPLEVIKNGASREDPYSSATPGWFEVAKDRRFFQERFVSFPDLPSRKFELF